ncbi:hypothetical protein HOK51_08065 [Candidatus Woesearchaeota archaeon]|jgi:hypothetical protein|nr:hypothetical protein [Candidatus Woesearchaeota archaeon]MBT6519781.1 hypothetical protein [Candidatus Woesearchaeota archaeon]MBT7368160.1 hypothetical protein [Candidatus Woesearchaeota archaeon]
MECKQEENKKSCKCTYAGCSRSGKCCECVRYHRNRRELPACFFSVSGEKSYDRSFEKFVEENS